MERAIEVQNDLYLCFIDYSKAFDKVKYSDLFDILLRHSKIPRNIKHHWGVSVGGNNINNQRYADDTVLIADSEEKLQNITKTVTVEVKTKDFNWMQRRLSAWSSQNSQTYLYVIFFAKGNEHNKQAPLN